MRDEKKINDLLSTFFSPWMDEDDREEFLALMKGAHSFELERLIESGMIIERLLSEDHVDIHIH